MTTAPTNEARTVCAWCSDRVDAVSYSVTKWSPTGEETTHFCSPEHAVEWLEAD